MNGIQINCSLSHFTGAESQRKSWIKPNNSLRYSGLLARKPSGGNGFRRTLHHRVTASELKSAWPLLWDCQLINMWSSSKKYVCAYRRCCTYHLSLKIVSFCTSMSLLIFIFWRITWTMTAAILTLTLTLTRHHKIYWFEFAHTHTHCTNIHIFYFIVFHFSPFSY